MPCAIGAVSYAYLDEDGNARRDVLYCYDLELPADFTPRPVDGEVERFDLRPVEWVVEKVVEGMEYKPNCNLVLIDFFVRYERPSRQPSVRIMLTLLSTIQTWLHHSRLPSILRAGIGPS